MTYKILAPPFSLKFREMDKASLKAYADWLKSQIPCRRKVLSYCVRETPGFETWQDNCLPESLDSLGLWYATQIETRPRTPAELERLKGGLVNIEDHLSELTDRTFSLAIDVGLYVSSTFFNQNPVLRWDQPFGSKRYVDYGQPVIIGSGKVPFNPVRMMVTLAYGVAKKHKTGHALRKIYDTWEADLTATP